MKQPPRLTTYTTGIGENEGQLERGYTIVHNSPCMLLNGQFSMPSSGGSHVKVRTLGLFTVIAKFFGKLGGATALKDKQTL